ncbi:grasp-with-spasm system SPASM domain peptide maturase [Neolewinella lacunae]|uniref:grasp-with-spasm system SPASM domain peptide maturase n=1 Tax=Neolewinella lacunae TaxID=1517758 RepID=UPI0025B40375|nr:grasp-with-spasm system SPASM domain peptide maturase [Neolewinella lacunae]MDN3636146.1 grasp-with-spasm system SPASM domain peptide maturase [Neolewinella lacunae]
MEVILPYSEETTPENLANLGKLNPYIFSFTVFSSPENKFINTRKDVFGLIFYSKEAVYSEKCCGKISPSFFTINTKTFTESVNFNSCLNRKIAIDVEGRIKNCPSMSDSFGIAGNITFEEILKKPSFKDKWNINKNLINVCKDCEFRYVCTDCRAYIENPEESLSKPLKCGYDPYTGEWQEWTFDSSKKSVIEHYSLFDWRNNPLR